MTAVEWLVEQITDGKISAREAIDKAKAMEKEQIEDAYNKGEFNQGCNGDGEQYYNETFKSE